MTVMSVTRRILRTDKTHITQVVITQTVKTYSGKTNSRYVYNFLADHGGWDNWEMVLIKTECCEHALDAKRKEREYIELLNATLNMCRPYIDKEDKAEYKAKWGER